MHSIKSEHIARAAKKYHILLMSFYGIYKYYDTTLICNKECARRALPKNRHSKKKICCPFKITNEVFRSYLEFFKRVYIKVESRDNWSEFFARIQYYKRKKNCAMIIMAGWPCIVATNWTKKYILIYG